MPIILRQYQETCKTNIYSAWDEGHQNVLLVKPTGMGKTKLFCSVAVDFAIKASQIWPTAIMVHRKELVQQISLTLAEEDVMHNIIAPRKDIIGMIVSHRRLFRKPFYEYSAPITVISVDTLNARKAQHMKWAESIKLWITDEAAHLLKNNKWGKAVSLFPNAKGLGVTATPKRLDKRGLGRHADGVFDVMVKGPTTRWGIKNGFLCKYKIAIPASDYKDFLKNASSGSDYSREAMAEAAKESHIVGDVVDNYKKFTNGKQAIVFASDIGSGNRMEEKFNEAGIPAKILTGFSTDADRLEGMIAFREKRIKVLINVDLFDEGLDVPGIEAVIMARPTMSLSKYLQMCGRGLRPAANKEYLIIIDHVGNVVRHGLPDEEREWTLDREVKRQQKINLIRICANIDCNAPFDRLLSECPYCGLKLERAQHGGGSRVGPAQVDGDLELVDPETLAEMLEKTVLESPESVAKRVGHVAGKPAGIKAMKNQIERIETQKELSQQVALWAGHQRHEGLSDRQIHKKFFLLFDKTITQALAEPKADMTMTINRLNYSMGLES